MFDGETWLHLLVISDPHVQTIIQQAVGGRPPRYVLAPLLPSPVGAEAPSAAEQTTT